jgi:hypothetical protein
VSFQGQDPNDPRQQRGEDLIGLVICIGTAIASVWGMIRYGWDAQGPFAFFTCLLIMSLGLGWICIKELRK